MRAMSRIYLSYDLEQKSLLPPDLRDWLPEGHLALFISNMSIAEFRKRHLQELAGLFVQVLKLCERAGLVKLGHVAIDGSKLRANASKHKAMSYERMCEKEQ